MLKKEKRKRRSKAPNPDPQQHRPGQDLKSVKYQNPNEPNMADAHTADVMVEDSGGIGHIDLIVNVVSIICIECSESNELFEYSYGSAFDPK